jgi:choline dehydrogenase
VVQFLPAAIRQLLDITEGTVFIALNDSPNSRGSVSIVSANPLVQPRVNFNDFSDGGPSDFGSDANNVVRFFELLQDVATAAGGTVLYPTPAQYAAGNDALFAAGLASFIEAFHMSGTCSMGTSAANGVVDGKGNVFGVDGLVVASNSIAPVISDANTGLQAYIIGWQIAQELRNS